MNKIFITGYIGQDADVRQTNDNYMMRFSVASAEHHGETETTTWFSVVHFAKNDKKAALLKKGNKLFIEGRLQERQYTDKSGTERKVTEVLAERFELM